MIRDELQSMGLEELFLAHLKIDLFRNSIYSLTHGWAQDFGLKYPSKPYTTCPFGRGVMGSILTAAIPRGKRKSA